LTVAVNASGTVTTPSGYTLLDTLTQGGLVIREYGKISDGTESGTLAVTFATATRANGTLKVRHSSTGFDSTVLNNFSAFQHDTATSVSAITTTALTSVPANAWLEACGAAINTVTAAHACTVTGTNWTERNDTDNSSSSLTCVLDAADNATDTGTANTATFTWTNGTFGNLGAISYYLILRSAAGNPFFWSM
jgi:hypothetical protein